MTERRPNILFVIADDASHFGAYGHSFVNTPAFDRIAAEGVLFNNMFTTNPKCAPSRASILTGQHTWQLKSACTHFCVFPGKQDFEVYPDLLEEAGYSVGFTGKGWGPGDYQREGRTRNPAGPEFNACFLERPEGVGVSPKDYSANFQAFLEARSEDKPFCFWFGAHEPHRGYVYGEGAANGKRPEDIKEVPPYWPDDETIRNDMLDYAYEIEWMDSHLGRILEKLEDIGELENTLVIATSDNGCPFPRVKGQMYDDDFRLPFAAMWQGKIASGRVCDDLCSFIDLMPTFLEVAGVPIPEELPGRSLSDVFFSEKSGMITDYRNRALMGRERHDIGREGDKGYPVRCIRTPQFLYVRNYEPDRWPAGNPETNFTNCDDSPTKSRVLALREEGEDRLFQYAFGKRPSQELYDINTDPYCMKNLACEAEYDSLKADLCEEMESSLKESDDRRMYGRGEEFDDYEYVGDKGHSWENWIKKKRNPALSSTQE